MKQSTAKDISAASRVKAKLTPRELEILNLMAQAMSNREISTALLITEGTVKMHVHNTLLKLGVNSRTRAIARGLKLHLLHI
jgi:DNA-binding NarL/FixJ family response regulator